MKFFYSIRSKFTFVVCLLFSSSISIAQTVGLSPYSRYGLGDINSQVFARQLGMGGAALAVYDPYGINILNPATYQFAAKPIFEIGTKTTYLEIKSSLESQKINNTSINNIAITFPVINQKWGLTFGALPYSSKGYKVTRLVQLQETEVKESYQGEGGLTKLFIGNGVRLYDKFDSLQNFTSVSAGINANYIFGSLLNTRRTIFPSSSVGFFNTKIENNTFIKDFSLETGLHFQTNLIKKKSIKSNYLKLMAGITYQLGGNLNAQQSLLVNSFSYTSFGTEDFKDTVAYSERIDGTIYLPSKIGIGMALDFYTQKNHRWLLAADVNFQNWVTYKEIFTETTNYPELVQDRLFTAGLQYTPDYKTTTNFLKKTEYRIGLKSEFTPLKLKENQITDVSITAGLGMPVFLKSLLTHSTFNIGAEMGRKGTIENSLLQENYINIFIGLTIIPHFRDQWFVQKKYE
jgi:hypothetical protein